VTSFLVADRAPLVYPLPNLINPTVHTKPRRVYTRTCARLQIRNLLHMLGAQITSCQLSEVGKWITRQYLFTDLCQKVMSDLGRFACCSSASQVASYGYFSASLAFRWSYA